MIKGDREPMKNTIMDRRRFLKYSGLLGLGLGAGGLMPTGSEAVRFDRQMHKVSSNRIAMGTFVSMTLIHPSRDEAQEAMERAFVEIDRLSRLLSRFDGATPISALNREGTLTDIPPEVMGLIRKSMGYYQLTGGAFDVTVKPVVDLFAARFSDPKRGFPSQSEMRHVLDCVGSDKILMEEKAIRFLKPDMGITLDGIAKGYIVDRASEILRNRQIANHLINAGGDIRAVGRREDGEPWVIAVEDPKKRSQYPDKIRLSDGAIATSGNYEVYFDREKMYHHIIDPKTGRSPHHTTSVSVTAPTAMDADALSTSVFVMKPEQGIRFIDTLPGCECFLFAAQGRSLKSDGWSPRAI
jgi:FAD:protein FMN transferase